MKRFTKTILLFVMLFAVVLGLAGCSNVSQKFADEINEAAKAKTNLTWTEVYDKLGADYVGLSAGDADKVTGWVWWYKGCKTQEEVDAKLEEGKSVKYIRVNFFLGKATEAEFGELTPEEEK